EGIAVDSLFESAYAEFRDIALRAGTRLQFEVIEWESLVVAADKGALRDVLRVALETVLSTIRGGSVTMRAFSYMDDACVMFEILHHDATFDRASDDPWKNETEALQNAIRHMGGELDAFDGLDTGFGLHFWLSQWVGAADESLVA